MRDFQLDPNFERNLTAVLEPKLEKAGDVPAVHLRERLSAGARSGRQYPALPRQSSAPGEYPQEQEGDLKASVENNPTNDPIRREVGFFGDDQGKLNNLEFVPPAQGGRAPLAKTFDDSEVKAGMLEAFRE